jgi:hypothetical protein
MLGEQILHIGFLIFHSRLLSHSNMALNAWVLVSGLSNWNSFFLVSASWTTHPTMPMCHAILVVLLKPLVAFQNTIKRGYICKPWIYVSPNSVSILSSNTWWCTTLSCELVIIVEPHKTSCSQMQSGAHLAWTPHREWNCLHWCGFQTIWWRPNFVSNVFYCSSFHLKDKSFLRRSKSGFISYKKPFINFR